MENNSSVISEKVDSLISIVSPQIKSNDPSKLKVALTSVLSSYANLVNKGQLEVAKQYANSIKEYVSKNSEKFNVISKNNKTLNELILGIKHLPTNTQSTMEEALTAIKYNAKLMLDSTGKAVIQEAASNANKAIAPIVQKANEANKTINEAKQKVDEKTNQANATIDAAKKLLTE